MPAVEWKVTSLPRAGRHELSVSAKTEGALARVEGWIDPVSRDGAWTIREAKVDLASWFAIMQRQRQVLPAGTIASGEASLLGEGTLKAGEPAGRFEAKITDASVSNEEQGWSATGIAAQFQLPAWPSLHSDLPHVYSFRSAKIANLEFRDGQLTVASEDPSLLKVLRGTLKGVGGLLTIDPFQIDVQKPATTMKVRVRGVDLGQLKTFLPAMVTDIAGRVDGDISLTWSAERGVEACEVLFVPEAGSPAMMKLAVPRGTLSGNFPVRFQLLPKTLGRVSEWFLAANNPVHETLTLVETSRVPLTIQRIHIRYVIDEKTGLPRIFLNIPTVPDVEGKKKGVIKIYRFNVNIDMPLTDFIRMALREDMKNLSFGLGN